MKHFIVIAAALATSALAMPQRLQERASQLTFEQQIFCAEDEFTEQQVDQCVGNLEQCKQELKDQGKRLNYNGVKNCVTAKQTTITNDAAPKPSVVSPETSNGTKNSPTAPLPAEASPDPQPNQEDAKDQTPGNTKPQVGKPQTKPPKAAEPADDRFLSPSAKEAIEAAGSSRIECQYKEILSPILLVGSTSTADLSCVVYINEKTNEENLSSLCKQHGRCTCTEMILLNNQETREFKCHIGNVIG
ncbi:hypothetical protein CDD81_1556 [Ophiocordyceps australis]|uniref:Uncharacterized protein n=1 Tax=Ophiocordyceps australis TaxID=1399860 RepID=A0A2C5Y0Z2_9HYPO|nr:hypothetical protein CDD81_1556 [Ophiocordyceps australis]